jgi:protein-L-isoaspartate(D-aspartate) O-methyltransferase
MLGTFMSADFAAERTTMVDSQMRTQDVTDLSLIDAMRAIPREALVPPGKSYQAYADAEVEYAPGRWMLRPRDVSKLLQAVLPRAGERALAISAPYAAAVFSALGLDVTQRDAGEARAISGEYDVVMCEGAVAKTPAAWIDALAPGGRLAIVERDGPVGHAILYVRSGETIGARALFDATPPVLAGFEARRAFVF